MKSPYNLTVIDHIRRYVCSFRDSCMAEITMMSLPVYLSFLRVDVVAKPHTYALQHTYIDLLQ